MTLPHVRGIYHAGLTVSDIERSIAFYRDVLGLELAWRQESDTPYIAQLTGLPGTHLKVAYLKPAGADGPFIELLQYLAPAGTAVDTTPNNPGTAHVCFFVEDLQASYRDLSERGVRFVSEPIQIAAGVHKGSSTVYAKDPDGITLEFFQR
jgi:catechol 2,3-dioxygenase-like lactoylglutathione lyase family enzyme